MKGYFEIVAQDEHVFWLSIAAKLEDLLMVGRAEDGSGVIYLHTAGVMFTYLGEYSSEARAEEVLAELKQAYKIWNPKSTNPDNPLDVLKTICAKDYYEMPKEDQKEEHHGGD